MKELVILKLDFEKTFDKVEHEAMIQIMLAKSFGPKWMRWMKMFFFWIRHFSILLDGTLGKTFYCRRGVRQRVSFRSFLFWLQTSYNRQTQD